MILNVVCIFIFTADLVAFVGVLNDVGIAADVIVNEGNSEFKYKKLPNYSKI